MWWAKFGSECGCAKSFEKLLSKNIFWYLYIQLRKMWRSIHIPEFRILGIKNTPIKFTFNRCVKLFSEFLPLYILNDISKGKMFLIFEKSWIFSDIKKHPSKIDECYVNNIKLKKSNAVFIYRNFVFIPWKFYWWGQLL